MLRSGTLHVGLLCGNIYAYARAHASVPVVPNPNCTSNHVSCCRCVSGQRPELLKMSCKEMRGLEGEGKREERNEGKST
ncbi:hypothetical protein KQX54_019045 [Cotesia glomerata]|uniref:Secreted protein n=1 Tax=Cotesia glomerata TaxID=32391 RepID=A0AAV7I3Q1_COTGL|nr:hypothetical protein KQX54_019045 [Cotesia glomerata]